MNVQESYNRWAESYDADRNLTRDLDGELTQSFLRESRFESVVEAGCGTGKNTIFLAERAERVVSLDFSVEMLARAQEKVSAPHVKFQQADLSDPWPVEDDSADLVMCNLVLEHIEDLEFVFSEARRVLLPTGLFRISELHPFRQYQGKQAQFDERGQTILIEAFMHHVSEFLAAAEAQQFKLKQLQEHWHGLDLNKPPRLITFLFE
ncbi:putative S-adenosylmethionine-dependent methyltransferase/MSMEI_2290 [Gimesia chilikensis]|uniref:Putative S-adenosylmethionine-dependent methyltransferase/MSMEI_2290 n=1 Tax=Gimesia chilikensis TaxID=2605989 RepID=A0A517WDA8_9PLAN|nr:class I SAM-dependent methyltransferase [Gimesia chilikensis]QDU03228.1 putative S-adenosylmethionine-dependent methyltransferase/MSMEI_2290 [Gimesia chilikensis]